MNAMSGEILALLFALMAVAVWFKWRWIVIERRRGVRRPTRRPSGADCFGFITDGDVATVRVLEEGYMTPTAVQPMGDTLWVGESKLAYKLDPRRQGQDPGIGICAASAKVDPAL